MPIEQSKHKSHSRAVGRFYEDVFPWQVVCDFCSKPAYKKGDTAGDAADEARKDGFCTIPSKVVALPSRWCCKDCKAKLDAGEKIVPVSKLPSIPVDAPFVPRAPKRNNVPPPARIVPPPRRVVTK